METADGRRMLLRQHGEPVLFAVQRVTHRGVHYARTGSYVSPLPHPRADLARALREASPDEDAWSARWAHHFAEWLGTSANGPLHEGDWQLVNGMPGWTVERHWPELLSYDPDRGHLTWFGYGDPVEDARDVLPLRTLSAPDSARVKAFRRQYREGVLPPVLLWWLSGLNSLVVLDGHERLVAALAEGGRPSVVILGRATSDAWVEWVSGPRTVEYEKRIAHFEKQRVEGEPLAGSRIAGESRRFADDLHSMGTSPCMTRAWPLPGGPQAWLREAADSVPGWRPDADR
ncbi:hypothetical protein [Streptomyces beijiangensis]|uniref:Uncharacterized protein n=2 Tax=Streptomyces beijiangensis TaxID=163361 RepID=A0A939FAM2_9ACTN|nr:hypothetical protein [Streptomyces beijiangensis]MBO0514674.1 hypothetical protein [Streptomyces beijiangensis]